MANSDSARLPIVLLASAKRWRKDFFNFRIDTFYVVGKIIGKR